MIKEHDLNKYAELCLAINRCCQTEIGLGTIMSLYDFDASKEKKLTECKQLLEDVANILDNERDKIIKEIQ